jgi:hypothetical protein
MAAESPSYDDGAPYCGTYELSSLYFKKHSKHEKPARFAEAGTSQAYWHLALLTLQQADGSFLLGQELADWAGRKLKELRAWARKLVPGGSEAESVLATALALVLLEKKAADASDQWQAAAAKVRAWLGNHRSTLEGLPVEDWLRQNLK